MLCSVNNTDKIRRAELETRYFTDREYGQRPAVAEKIEGRVWDALQESVEMRLDNGAFGYRFTAQCADGDGPCGCDRRAFARFVKAEVPSIDWPLDRDDLPDTPVILDLLEFCAPRSASRSSAAITRFSITTICAGTGRPDSRRSSTR